MATNDTSEMYEPPQLAEVGGFAEETLGAWGNDCEDIFGPGSWLC
jgi:hypothetical protein